MSRTLARTHARTAKFYKVCVCAKNGVKGTRFFFVLGGNFLHGGLGVVQGVP